MKSKIICIDFSKFKNFSDLMQWLSKEENRKYKNVYYKMDRSDRLSYSKEFDDVEKIWIIGDFITSIKKRKYDDIIFSPEINEFILEESIDITDPSNIESDGKFDIKFVGGVDTKEVGSIILELDSILDRISKLGVDGITEKERKYLKENYK